MKSYPFSDPAKAVTSEDLKDVERRFRFSFPRAIWNHYLTVNGGSPERCLFPESDSFCVIAEFLSIKHGEDTLEETVQELTVERHVVPRYLVPFASDPGGDYFCFSVRKKDFGAIYIFRGEYADDMRRAVRFLANSFSIFMRRLKPEATDPSQSTSVPPRPPGKHKKWSASEKKAIFEGALRVLQTGRKMNCPQLLKAMAARGYLAEGPTQDTKIALYESLMKEIQRGEKSRIKLTSSGFALTNKD